MRINRVIWYSKFVDKLWDKHQVEVHEVEDRPGSIKEVTDVIREYGGRMGSILTSYDMVPEGFRRVYIRMYGIDRFKINRLKEALKEKARLLYMVDRRETTRETF
ncbi:MAG: hypothetical protein P8012_13015 [Desulfobacterales bacterium]